MEAIDTILIIEDDAGLSELLAEKMTECSYKTVAVYSGSDALNWLEKNIPFLIILDYSLPDMNGFEFISTLSQNLTHLPPFVVSTGQGDERIAVDMLKLGARDYIIKDNNFLEMISLIITKVGKEIRNDDKLKRTEQALLELSLFNQQIIKSAQEGIVVYDLNTSFKVWNPFMEKLTGLLAADVIGKNPANVLPFLVDYGVVDAVAKAFNGETSTDIDFPFNIHHSSKSGWISETVAPLRSASGNIIGSISTVRDITDRKISEAKLKESEEMYRTMIEHSNDLVWSIDVDGNFTFLNDIAEKAGDLKLSDWIGKPFVPLVIPEDLPMIMGIIERNLQGESCSYDLRFKRSDGSILIASVNTSPIYKNGVVDGIVSFGRDITEKKRAEQELISAKEKAEESSRLKTAFLNNVSHEFRTPMNAIMGFTQFLVNNSDDLSQREMFGRIVQNACNQLLDIVTDVVEISEIQSNQMFVSENDINLTNIFDQLNKQLQKDAIDKNLEFSFNSYLVGKQSQTITDSYKLSKILKHLITNAIKFTYSGAIKIECNLINQNEYSFTITDSGIGISEDMQQKIFEPFTQVETGATRTFGGPGIGLSIAKAYIEIMGGKISLQSEINKGTSITFTMPYRPSDAVGSNDTANGPKLDLSDKTILIAEDELSNFVLLREFLTPTNAKILHAKNGEEAIDFCRNSANIDLVLMDIKMPVLDGYEAAKQIKVLRPSIQIIAQTAYIIEQERKLFTEIAFDDYLTKPISQFDFSEILMKFLHSKSDVNVAQ